MANRRFEEDASDGFNGARYYQSYRTHRDHCYPTCSKIAKKIKQCPKNYKDLRNIHHPA